MTPFVFRIAAAIDSEVLAAATLRVDNDEDAAAANGDEVEVGVDWDICCPWRYNGTAKDDGDLPEDREDKDGLDNFPMIGIIFRLVPQRGLGIMVRSSVLGLSSLSPSSNVRATPNSESVLAAVLINFVDGPESVCAVGVERERESLEPEGPRRKGALASGVRPSSSVIERPLCEERLDVDVLGFRWRYGMELLVSENATDWPLCEELFV